MDKLKPIFIRIKFMIRKARSRFNLREDMATEEAIVEGLVQGSEISGTNLWLLISSILIASVGLNVNSAAVVIGAMLISPFMGPIMGISLGVATFRFSLIQSAARSFGFAIVASVTTSTIYFLISPLSEAQSELLARTNPSIWDVLIALIGGLAGMIGQSRKKPGNVLPGVAIATALMPPLCTAGFGIAMGNWEYFLGAFYLFFINSVFICLGGILILKILRIRLIQIPHPRSTRFIRFATIGIAIFTVIPSLFLTYQIVHKAIIEENINRFLEKEIKPLDLIVLSKNISIKKNESKIEIAYVGKKITPESEIEIKGRLKNYGLAKANLTLQSLAQGTTTDSIAAIRANLMEELFKKSKEGLIKKDDQIHKIETVIKDHDYEALAKTIGPELAIHMPGLKSYSLARSPVYLSDGNAVVDRWILTGKIQVEKTLSNNEEDKLENWLKLRFEAQESDIKFIKSEI